MRHILVGTVLTLGLAAAGATAADARIAAKPSASSSLSSISAVQCQAINLAANVSNLGIGYVFNHKCSPAHPLVVHIEWRDAQNNTIGLISTLVPKAQPGVWYAYSGTQQRPDNGKLTATACIWVYQDYDWWLGGQLLTSKCFPKNS
jgi:hypothetical protein